MKKSPRHRASRRLVTAVAAAVMASLFMSSCALFVTGELRSVRADLDTFTVSNHPTSKRGNDTRLRVMNSRGKLKIAYLSFPVGSVASPLSASLRVLPKQSGFDLTVHNVAAFTDATTHTTRPAIGSRVGTFTRTKADKPADIALDRVTVVRGRIYLAVLTTSPYELELVSSEGAERGDGAAAAPTVVVEGEAASQLTTGQGATTTPANTTPPTTTTTTAPPTTTPPTTTTTPPPAVDPTLGGDPLPGTIVPAQGAWSTVADFESNTVPLEMIRAFPAGKTLTPSLAQVDGAIQRYPGTGVMWSTFMANRNFTDAQVAEFARAIRARAYQLPWLDIAVDAEPDRKDRSYTVAQFVEGFARLKAAVGPHPKIRWVLNLTGYQFEQRIGAYRNVLPLVDVLAIDPYWNNDMRPNSIQGGNQDIIDAAEWAEANGKAFAFGEWGAQVGANQSRNLDLAFDAIELTRPEYFPYFHDVGGSGTGCWLSGESFRTYSQRAAAL